MSQVDRIFYLPKTSADLRGYEELIPAQRLKIIRPEVNNIVPFTSHSHGLSPEATTRLLRRFFESSARFYSNLDAARDPFGVSKKVPLVQITRDLNSNAQAYIRTPLHEVPDLYNALHFSEMPNPVKTFAFDMVFTFDLGEPFQIYFKHRFLEYERELRIRNILLNIGIEAARLQGEIG